MYAKTLALLAVSAFSISAQAAPAASGSASASNSGSAAHSPSATESAAVTLPIPTQLGFPTGTVTLSDAVHWVNVHSDAIASYVGSSTLRDIQATLGVMDAQKSIGTATHLTAFVATDANSAPVAMVSSIGGSAITLATGTAVGGTTTFGGQVFRTAAPAVLAADSSSSSSAAASTSTGSSNSTMSSSASTSTSTGSGNGAAGGVRVSRSAVVGALGVLGSVAMGALAVL